MTIETYYPGLNKVLVEKQDLPKTNSILATSSSILSYGKLIGIGDIKDKKDLNESTYKAGDFVYFLSQAGLDVDLPCGQFRLLNITDILIGKAQ